MTKDVQKNPRRSFAQRSGYHLTRRMTQLLTVSCCGMRVEGRHWVPSSGPVLVCSNHQSYFDPILIGLSCRRRMNYLARKTLFRHPIFRHLIRYFDAIPIDRDGLGIQGIKETIRRLRLEADPRRRTSTAQAGLLLASSAWRNDATASRNRRRVSLLAKANSLSPPGPTGNCLWPTDRS
jgi:hypothetical protein